jgi:hypothetical protein
MMLLEVFNGGYSMTATEQLGILITIRKLLG